MRFEISVDDIADIYAQMFAGLIQQSLEGQFEANWHEFPRDPVFIAKGVAAAFGIRFRFITCDFYEDIEDIEEYRRDLFCFHEHNSDRSVTVYVNSNLTGAGEALLSLETQRFATLKEVFIAALRRHFKNKGRPYPDTMGLIDLNVSLMDWLIEKPSIFDIGGADDSPVPSIENAAEILALVSLANLPEIHGIRSGVNRVDGVGAKDLENEFWSVFRYSDFAARYGLHHRHTLVLFRTTFVDKFYTIVAPKLDGDFVRFDDPGRGSRTFPAYVEAMRPTFARVYGDILDLLEKALKEGSMDIITFLGIAGSLASIVSFLQGKSIEITPERIRSELDERARRAGTTEHGIRSEIGNESFSAIADEVIAAYESAPLYLERIQKKCIVAYNDTVRNHGNETADVLEAREIARKCVCSNIHLAMKDNYGKFPSDTFRKLWERFDCGM